MKRALALLVLAGCPDNNNGNPSTLWLAPDQNETHVKLIDHEPPPF
jgi:hypothetical protein